MHSPNDISSLLLMAELSYAREDSGKAKQMIARYELSTRKFSAQAITLAYKVFKQSGDSEKAQQYLTMLLKMFPNSNEAKAYFENGLSLTSADKLKAEYQAQHKEQTRDSEIVAEKPVVKLKASQASTMMALAPDNTPRIKADALTEQQMPAAEILPEVKPSPSMTASPKLKQELPVHIIERGQNLFYISKTYNIAMRFLKKWNNISDENDIKAGDKIYLADPKK
jgi:type IV pilus assembly protein PilF